jgi:hypothetical protein
MQLPGNHSGFPKRAADLTRLLLHKPERQVLDQFTTKNLLPEGCGGNLFLIYTHR